MVGRLVKSMGEPRVIALSLVLVGASLGPMAFIHHWAPLMIALAVLSIGTSLTRAPVFGLISILAPVNEQGVTLGVAQSAGSLARMSGPLFAATLFVIHPAWPYVISGALSFVTALIVVQLVVPAHSAPVAAETSNVDPA
jgi:MFS family permease